MIPFIGNLFEPSSRIKYQRYANDMMNNEHSTDIIWQVHSAQFLSNQNEIYVFIDHSAKYYLPITRGADIARWLARWSLTFTHDHFGNDPVINMKECEIYWHGQERIALTLLLNDGFHKAMA